jgi:hypothetical protein
VGIPDLVGRVERDSEGIPVSLSWGWSGGCVPVLRVAGWMFHRFGGGRLDVSLRWGWTSVTVCKQTVAQEATEECLRFGDVGRFLLKLTRFLSNVSLASK